MKHQKFRETILRRSLGRELSPSEARALTRHLQACPACQEFSERLGTRGREVLPVPRLRPNFKREFLARLAREDQTAQAKPGLAKPGLNWESQAKPGLAKPGLNQESQAKLGLAKPGLNRESQAKLKPGLNRRFQNLLAVAASLPLILTSLYLGHLALKTPPRPDSLKSSLADDPLKLAVKRASGIKPSDFELRLEHGERTVYHQQQTAQTTPLADKQEAKEDGKSLPEIPSQPRVASETRIGLPKSLTAPEQRLMLDPKNEQAGNESSGLRQPNESRVVPSELDYLGVVELKQESKQGNEDSPRSKTAREERSELEAESVEPPRLEPPREERPDQAKKLVKISIPTVAVRLELSQPADLELARHRAEEIKLALKNEFPAGTEIQLESGITNRQESEDPIESKLKASQEAEDLVASAKPETHNSVFILLWLCLAGLVRLFNIVAGALRPEKKAPRLDLVLGALLGSFWLPRIISRLIGSR